MLTTSGFINLKMFILKTIRPSDKGANILSSQLYFSFYRVEPWALVLHFNALLPDSQLHDCQVARYEL
jgi:hypothetical protein